MTGKWTLDKAQGWFEAMLSHLKACQDCRRKTGIVLYEVMEHMPRRGSEK